MNNKFIQCKDCECWVDGFCRLLPPTTQIIEEEYFDGSIVGCGFGPRKRTREVLVYTTTPSDCGCYSGILKTLPED